MKQFKIKENYLLLTKWWENIDLTNYEKSFFNKEFKTEDFPTPDLPYTPILILFSLSLKSC